MRTLAIGALVATGLVGASAPAEAAAWQKLAEWALAAGVSVGVTTGLAAMWDWAFADDKPPRPSFGEPSEAYSEKAALLSDTYRCVPGYDLFHQPLSAGVHYYFGTGPYQQDLHAAAVCLRYGADADDPVAKRMLGYMYLYGEGGLPKDPDAFFRLEESAVGEGDVVAEYNLGLAYCYAFGVHSDPALMMSECRSLLQKAALAKYEPAINALAKLHKIGVQ